MKNLIKIFTVFSILLFVGCSADAKINTSKKGEGPISATVIIYESDGKTVVTQNSSDSGGNLTVNLDYGSYKIKSSANGYDEAQGNLKVDLLGAIFGIDINMPMAKKPVAVNILENK